MTQSADRWGTDLQEYRRAPSGEGPHAPEWANKPHRLIYDLCEMVQQLREKQAEPRSPVAPENTQLDMRQNDPDALSALKAPPPFDAPGGPLHIKAAFVAGFIAASDTDEPIADPYDAFIDWLRDAGLEVGRKRDGYSLSLHRCKVCGTRWLLWPNAVHGGGWNLLDQYQHPDSCCDTVAMGEQIEYLRDLVAEHAPASVPTSEIAELQTIIEARDLEIRHLIGQRVDSERWSRIAALGEQLAAERHRSALYAETIRIQLADLTALRAAAPASVLQKESTERPHWHRFLKHVAGCLTCQVKTERTCLMGATLLEAVEDHGDMFKVTVPVSVPAKLNCPLCHTDGLALMIEGELGHENYELICQHCETPFQPAAVPSSSGLRP